MKYLLVFAIVCSHSLYSMERKEQLKRLREMHGLVAKVPHEVPVKPESPKATRSPKTPRQGKKTVQAAPISDSEIEENPIVESIDKIQRYFTDELEHIRRDYHDALQIVSSHSEQRDERMAHVISRQTETILQLNDLIKALMRRGTKLEARVAVNENDVLELRQDSDRQVESLLSAVNDQSEMFVRQNAVIRELMSRVEKLSSQSSDQRRKHAALKLQVSKMDLEKEQLALQIKEIGVKIVALQKHAQTTDDKETMRQLDDLLQYFNYKQVKVVTPEPEDQAIYQQVFGDSGEMPLQSASYHGSSEAEARTASALREESPHEEDQKDRIPSASNTSDEIVEEIVIIEDADEEQAAQEAQLKLTRIRKSSDKGKEDVSN